MASLDDEQIDRAIFHLEAAKHDEIDALLRQEVASFEAGPLLWLTRYAKTENPHQAQSEAKGQIVPFLAGFPRKSYFVICSGEFLARHNKLFIPKAGP